MKVNDGWIQDRLRVTQNRRRPTNILDEKKVHNKASLRTSGKHQRKVLYRRVTQNFRPRWDSNSRPICVPARRLSGWSRWCTCCSRSGVGTACRRWTARPYTAPTGREWRQTGANDVTDMWDHTWFGVVWVGIMKKLPNSIAWVMVHDGYC